MMLFKYDNMPHYSSHDCFNKNGDIFVSFSHVSSASFTYIAGLTNRKEFPL